jgi:3-oxoacyl-[acyl-carrier protein] reductase
MDFSKSIAIITGGASGLGLAITRDILSAGGTSIVLDRDSNALSKLEPHPNLHVFEVDLLQTDKLPALIQTIFNDFKVNILVNNAGILHNKPLVSFGVDGFTKLSESEWDMVFNINLKAPFILCREISEHFIRNRIKGVIINISSIAAQGNLGQSAYSASKAALEAFTKVIAKELGPMGIRAAAIAPGFMNTTSTHHIMNPTYLNNLVKSVPLRKLGKDSEIAKAVKFIVENDYFTGKVLSIDGGLNL